MQLFKKVQVSIAVVVALFLTGASAPTEHSASPNAPAIATTVASPAMSDCFGCFPGGLGDPQICDSGEHFDQTGTAEFFGPRSQMHAGCSTDGDCGDHGECDPGEEAYETLSVAIAQRDAVTILQLLRTNEDVELNSERSAIQVIGCNKEVFAHLPIDDDLLAVLSNSLRQ